MSFPAYSGYRDSGVEWLGMVPDSWSLERLKDVGALNPSKQEAAYLADDVEVSFLPMEAIGETGELDLSRSRPVGEVRNGYSFFANGDVVFAKVTPCFENGKGAWIDGLIGDYGFGTTELTVIRPNDPADAHFVRWLIFSDRFRGPGAGAMQGAGGLKRVPDSFVATFRVPWPSSYERQAIAVFLDRETAKIDALVEEQRRLIELLKEKRQAVISYAVTKGLDPAVPTKVSGVAWLGEVPAHWNVSSLKHLCSRVVDCLHTTPTYNGELQFPAIRTADVERGKLLLGQARLVSREVYEERIQRLRPVGGDVLYSREGERFGMAALVPEGVDLCLGQRMMMFRCTPEAVPAYLMWSLNSDSVYQQVLSDLGGATSPHINISDIVNFKLPVPPVSEQQQIAGYISTQVERFDALLNGAGQTISLLQERRAALISAAVTGKIDVRGTADQQAKAA